MTRHGNQTRRPLVQRDEAAAPQTRQRLRALAAHDRLPIQRELVTYLGGVNVKSRVTLVRRTGWHEIAMNQVFVLPNETIGPRGAEQVILHASATGPYEAKGSLQGWQDSIGALLRL